MAFDNSNNGLINSIFYFSVNFAFELKTNRFKRIFKIDLICL